MCFIAEIVLLMITYGCVYSYCIFVLFASSWGGHSRHATLRRSQTSSVNDPNTWRAPWMQTYTIRRAFYFFLRVLELPSW